MEVGVCKLWVEMDIAFAVSCTGEAAISRLALKQITLGIIPENAIADIWLAAAVGTDAVLVRHDGEIREGG